MHQYTVVVKRPNNTEFRRFEPQPSPFFFSNFDSSKKAIEFISSKVNNGLKVHKIFKMDTDGSNEEMTIGFNDGVLDLINK